METKRSDKKYLSAEIKELSTQNSASSKNEIEIIAISDEGTWKKIVTSRTTLNRIAKGSTSEIKGITEGYGEHQERKKEQEKGL